MLQGAAQVALPLVAPSDYTAHMASHPLIGITADLVENSSGPPERALLPYCQAVAIGGGVPVVLPFVEDPASYAEHVDGWLIAGGRDVPPGEYGELPAPETEPISEARHTFEKRLWETLLPTGKPILGICYGCQFLNVRLGGSLFQHIPAALPMASPHAGGPGRSLLHRVALEADSRLAEACGQAEFDCSSSHHQAIRCVAPGLRIVARADDGVIEGVESLDGRWLVGVQWHPERTIDSPPSRGLMHAFVRAASQAAAL